MAGARDHLVRDPQRRPGAALQMGAGAGHRDHDRSVVAVDVLVIEAFGVSALPD